jgi:hypothetical protein
VGTYGTSGDTLAERWNGTAWTVESTPNPAGGSNDALAGVSCGAPGACVAVGGYYNGHGNTVLAETWNGTAWTIATVPLPAGALGGDLDGVSCTSASACTAVGDYANSGNADVALAETWNGTAWAVASAAVPSRATTSTLGTVSCSPSPSLDCEATGWYFIPGAEIAKELTESWNGTSWSIQATPTPKGSTGGAYPGGMSCNSPGACASVGTADTSSGGLGYGWAQGWNGTAWSNQTVGKPSGATASALSAVSCDPAPATACTTVGYDIHDSAFVTLAEGWNGSTWVPQPTPKPAGATLAALAGVSCSSASACSAVGYYTNSSGVTVTLAEGWNGTKWSIQKTPTP